MKNISHLFNDVYAPVKALLIHQSPKGDKSYVEAFDIGANGRPINAHPLSVNETISLAESLNTSTGFNNNFLKSEGLLPGKVLYIHPSRDGFAVWHTREQEVDLLFKEGLQIPSGKSYVPPLIWKATKNDLYLYAIKTIGKVSAKTPLFRAPFFNLYENDRVCMGTVDTGMEQVHSLEDFMAQWERDFWGSYFSHLIGEHSPVQGNIVQLWQQQVKTRQKFPLDVLTPKQKTIKDILV